MKVFTHTVWQMTADGIEVVEEHSHEYEGPVAECKGGGGSSTPYYANQDKLFGVQADIAGNLYNQYAAYAPSALNSLADMTSDATTGLYTQQLRDRALADSVSAAGMERRATERDLVSMGVNPNDPRFAASMRATGLRTAAQTANAVNKAGFDGDSMAWARTQDFYNSLAGLPSQSATMLASSANGYGQMAGAHQSQANANAAGYGQFGAMVANSMFADGGLVTEPRYALGGSVAGSGGGMPQIGDWRDYPSNYRPEKMSTMDKITSVASPVITAAAANQAGKGLSKLGREAWDALTAQPAAPVEEMAPVALDGQGAVQAGATQGQGLATTAGGAGAAEAGAGGAAAAEGVGTGAAAEAGGAAAAETAGAAATEAAAAEAAATAAAEAGSTAATGAMSAVSTAMPYVGAAMLAAQALDLFADGGQVPVRGLARQRSDLTKGGPVQGAKDPAAPKTSDHVPAWVTPKEYVLNVDAVEIAGEKNLDELNKAGLARRRGASKTQTAKKGKAAVRRMKGRAAKRKEG